MIQANRGDTAWWCALDAKKLEAHWLAPPASVTDAQFRAWVADYDARHTYSLEDELGEIDELCPLVNGERALDGRDAGVVLYVLCVDQCAVAEKRGRHQKSPARTLVDLCADARLARAGFRPALEAAGVDYAWFREGWRLLCKTAGFDLDTGGGTNRPAWLRDAGASMAGYSGLLDPADVRALAAFSGTKFRDALEVVRKKIDCSQDVDDLVLLVDTAPGYAADGHWLLGVQTAT